MRTTTKNYSHTSSLCFTKSLFPFHLAFVLTTSSSSSSHHRPPPPIPHSSSSFSPTCQFKHPEISLRSLAALSFPCFRLVGSLPPPLAVVNTDGIHLGGTYQNKQSRFKSSSVRVTAGTCSETSPTNINHMKL